MLADAYVAEDRAIMRSGKTVRDAAWLVTTEASSRWYACTKLPIRAPEAAATGGIIGVAGILVPYEGTGRLPMSYQRVEAALELARSGYAEGVRVSDLATAAGFSRNQFTRIFEELFHMTPGDYLLRMRVDHGRRLLSQTRKQITEIALESGFYDHSAFSKAFRRQTGMTPRDYRKRFAR
jgi:AraC-like DNA-binding protein